VQNRSVGARHLVLPPPMGSTLPTEPVSFTPSRSACGSGLNSSPSRPLPPDAVQHCLDFLHEGDAFHVGSKGISPTCGSTYVSPYWEQTVASIGSRRPILGSHDQIVSFRTTKGQDDQRKQPAGHCVAVGSDHNSRLPREWTKPSWVASQEEGNM
jgi:hypothetical protein